MFLPGEWVKSTSTAGRAYAGEHYVVKSSFRLGSTGFVTLAETGDDRFCEILFVPARLSYVIVAQMIYSKWLARA